VVPVIMPRPASATGEKILTSMKLSKWGLYFHGSD
jgi:hypothetical protein